MVCLVWAPNFPNLNPIERVWYLIKDVVQKTNPRPTTVPSLEEAIKTVWNNYDIDILNKLVESMPDRIAAAIEAHGENTRY